MVRRHGNSGFAAGALVFPGGKVDESDHALAARCPPATLLPYRIAAIRETWEEAGILLARRPGAANLLDHAEVPNPRETGEYYSEMAKDVTGEALELFCTRYSNEETCRSQLPQIMSKFDQITA